MINHPFPRRLEGELVLVTGAAGFIGSHLVDALLAGGARVRGMDNLATGRRENLSRAFAADLGNGRFELVEGDVRDREACRSACRGTSVVFHQAALGSVPRSLADPASTIAVNVAGTANVFSAARDAGVRRVVYASSSSVYGDGGVDDGRPRRKREGEEGLPLSPYAASKFMNEETGELFSRVLGLPTVGLRYFNVYGPRQDPEGPYAAVVPRFFHAYLTGEAPVVYGDGLQSRDFTYVGDAVSANLLAVAAPSEACGRAFNVAGGEPVAILDLARRIRALVGGRCEPRHEPARAGDVRHSAADPTLARAALGYSGRVGLVDGLARAREHYEALFEVAGSGRERREERA
jgi:nucleoside-diphosphate-sugar epimerase